MVIDMEELHFTWISAVKIFAALLLLGVWLVCRSQAKAERRAQQHGSGSVIAPRSILVMAIVAIVFLIIALLWGNTSTL